MTVEKDQEVRDAAAPRRTAAFGSILRNHDFVRLWAGESVSLIGTQITMFTLPLIAVLTLRATVFQVGVLNMSSEVPIIFLSLFAGVWLDRRRRRPILIACSLGNVVIMSLVPLGSVLGMLSMGLLYAVSTAAGVLSTIFDIGVTTYLPSLVGREHIAASNSRVQFSRSMSMVAGPGIAGLLIGVLTAPITITLDAVSYLCSAVGLISIRKPEPEVGTPGSQQTIRRSIAEGLRSVFANPILRSGLCVSGSYNFAQAAFATIFLVYAVRDLGLSPFKLGLVIGASAVGGIVGTVLANRAAETLGRGRAMLGSLGGAALCPLALILPRGSGLLSVMVMMLIEFCFGLGVLVYNVNAVSLRQMVTPDRLLGRVSASCRLVVMGVGPPGALLGGLLGQVAGLRLALLIAACAFPLTILAMLFSPLIRSDAVATGQMPTPGI